MDVLVLIDRLEELVEEARSFPGFGNTAMVDRDAAFDVIDQMRQTIPEELKQARWIVKERQAMLDETRVSFRPLSTFRPSICTVAGTRSRGPRRVCRSRAFRRVCTSTSRSSVM